MHTGLGEQVYDEKYHASGLINLSRFQLDIRREKGRVTDTLYQRWLRVASGVANINDEWDPAVVEHGLCVVSEPGSS